jgi:hypothetical protein
MNIFYIDRDPAVAAQMMVNSHVVKMILESAQLLSTAHRLLDGEMYIEISPKGRKIKRWRLPDERNDVLCHATHINHPSAIWCRESSPNYMWLYEHYCALLEEYTYRYGKVHKCSRLALHLKSLPHNLTNSTFSDPPPAMDKQYIISKDSVENYRNYYTHGKTHLHKWKKREKPVWMVA